MKPFDAANFALHFPLLNNYPELSYLDNAATTQKPDVLVKALSHYYATQNANVHRGSHQLSAQATTAFEQARAAVANWLNSPSSKQIIWTKGTTEAINLVANGMALSSGDEIVISAAEHHANLVPWQMLAQRIQAKLVILPLNAQGTVDLIQAEQLITERCKILAVTLVSNVIGKYNPINQLIALAQKVQARSLIDAAQAASHGVLDVQTLGCDFLVLSAHKVFGPTGIGVLYGKQQALNALKPSQFGGEMIKRVSFDHTEFNELPFVFEAGTPNIADVIAFAEVIKFLSNHQTLSWQAYEQSLTAYGYQQLSSISELEWLVEGCPDIPLFSFNIKNFHAQDIASALDSHNIAVRAGHHCAMPLLQSLAVAGCVRASLTVYNTKADIDKLVQALKQVISSSEHENSEQDAEQNFSQQLLTFEQLKSWQEKQRQLMLMGKALTPLADHLLTAQYLITGCESDAWLVPELKNNKLYFQGYSQAKIIRGLLVLILAWVNGKTPAEIYALDEQQYFSQLGLLQQLSPSRGNGLLAIIKAVKQHASEQLAS